MYDRNQKKNMNRRVVNSMKKEKIKKAKGILSYLMLLHFLKGEKLLLLQAKCYIASIIYNNMTSGTTTVLFKRKRVFSLHSLVHQAAVFLQPNKCH